MIYTHILDRGPTGTASPLDLLIGVEVNERPRLIQQSNRESPSQQPTSSAHKSCVSKNSGSEGIASEGSQIINNTVVLVPSPPTQDQIARAPTTSPIVRLVELALVWAKVKRRFLHTHSKIKWLRNYLTSHD